MSDKPVRLDLLLVQLGHAASRERARVLISEGGVRVDGVLVNKPSAQVRPGRPITLVADDFPWVGRGALKLLHALEHFQVDPAGLVAADLGSSTGGFTEVILHHGGLRVYAIDVGKGQLHQRLRTDPRVVVMEGTNARHLTELPERIDLIVGDLSFIGLALILPTVHRLLPEGGQAVLLVKPQFEAGREAIGTGGLVRDKHARAAAIARVSADATGQGFELLGGVDCAIPGAKAGNVEHFLHLRRGPG